MSTALLLVDIQNEYFPGGNMELEGSPEAGLEAGKLLSYFRESGRPLVFIQHILDVPGAKTFAPGTPGAAIHDSVRPLPEETVFQKHQANSFRDTPLLDHLKDGGVSRLVICGMMTHMCVAAAVRAAFDYGFECWVAHDACATRALSFEGREISAADVHGAFLAALSGMYARVMTAEKIISKLKEES